MSIWISAISGLLLLLLTTIGGLVLGRLVFMSKQISDNHTEFSAAITRIQKEFGGAVTAVWDDIKEERRRCGELHMAIARDVGSLQERTTNLREMIESNRADMMMKYDRTSNFWNAKAESIDRAMAAMQIAIMDIKRSEK